MASLPAEVKTRSTRDAADKEWAIDHARSCLRRASDIERHSLFSEEAESLYAEARLTLKAAGLPLSALK